MQFSIFDRRFATLAAKLSIWLVKLLEVNKNIANAKVKANSIKTVLL